jgi:MFS family permease
VRLPPLPGFGWGDRLPLRNPRRPKDATTALALLRYPQVRKLWAAALARSLAAWIAQIALIVGVLQHHAGSSLAWVLLASAIPALLAGLAAGGVVDRHDPRRVAQAAATAGILLLAGTGFGLAHSLAAGTVCYALFLLVGQLSGPASIRVLYASLSRDQRTAGNAAIGAVSGISTVVGAAIGGLGVATMGVVDCFVLAAAIQAVAAGALLLLSPAATHDESQLDFRRSIVEGLTAVRGYPLAASIILIGIAWGLIGGGYDVLIGLYGTRILRSGGGMAVGLLYAADGIGVLAGTLVAPRLPRRHQRGWYALAYGLQGCLWALFALCGDLGQAIPALLLMRVASGVIIALDTTLLLATVPDRIHGRICALHAMTYGAVGQVSLAVTGALLLSVSPRVVTLAAGVASITTGVIWWLATARTTLVDQRPLNAALPGNDTRPLEPTRYPT